MAAKPVEYTSRHRLWNVEVGFKETEQIFTIKINGWDFDTLPEVGKPNANELKAYRIGIR